MPKTVVGLFENPGIVDEVVREIEVRGFPRKEVRALEEPAVFESTGVMTFPRLDFETALVRELSRIGATGAESQGFLNGLRHGGTLVFATAPDERVHTTADIMNQFGAVEVTETTGVEPNLPHVAHNVASSIDNIPGHSVVFNW
jgi:hypothetical protein